MTEFDLVGIGNALVDVVVQADDGFLAEHDLDKGGMMLIDPDRADFLYSKMGPATESSGGSCGNTMAGFASFGGCGAYIGKVRDDDFGKVFRHDMNAIGVTFRTPAGDGTSTGRCLVLVTPDAQRTMCTYLGAATELQADDIDGDLIKAAAVTYLEGYLFDPPEAKAAFVRAAEMAHAAGRKVAITLSDSFCVDRHRDSFVHLVDSHIDILFANEDEIMSLYQVDNFDDALQAVRGRCEVACLTRSEKGSVIMSGDEVHVVDAEPTTQVIDTTGAGDQFAAGFLYGYTQGRSLAESGKLGGIAAAEVIAHYGARPEVELSSLLPGG
ncbi:MAG: adenosine kinase [Alphaproteobacteria bacterium]|nr:adenosine kinase [Alphaproteobacteria bacterium]